ncbi:hypothetical protein F5X98DRAFT_390376 [Xylaria grammica]|nr:hypothetical protein F5X98DRAFT_390376 [Xylaria grammica]
MFCTAEERRLLEGRRRLDEIIKQCFQTVNTLIYDTPDTDGEREIDSGNHPYYMSGALLPDASAEGNPFTAGSADDVGRDPINPRLLLIEPSFSLYEPIFPEDPAPLPPIPHKLESTAGSLDEYQEEAHRIRSDNEPFRVCQVQNRLTSPHSNWGSSNLLMPSGSPLRDSSGKIDSECDESIEGNPRQSSDQAQPGSSRRVTPVPAPQPWRRLGIRNPFGDDLPRTPTKRTHPDRHQAISTPRAKGITHNPPQP